MPPDFSERLNAFAEVIIRVGLNLQPGQPLLIAEPYEQQGVARSAEVIVDAITAAARAAQGGPVEIIWSERDAIRALVERADQAGFERLVAGNAWRMNRHVSRGGALLFLTGSEPRLFAGIPAGNLAAFHELNWRHLGPVVQRLVRGATQWSLAPAPSPAWAALAFPEQPEERQVASLWETVFAAFRVPSGDPPLAAWQAHLATLGSLAARLNARRVRTVRYESDGTDLSVELSTKHVWCTAQLTSRAGVPFVVNLPTEEVFTAPEKSSAEGVVRVSRPVAHGGAVMEGIELEFHAGKVVRWFATSNADLLEHLLATDSGASRLGEVALLAKDLGGDASPWQQSREIFHHMILDENAANHIALGAAYPFCLRGWFKFSANRSLVHVDLPLDARASLVAGEPT